jgi:hypothetical protein
MRYLPLIWGAGLLSAGLLVGSGQANAAMPTLTDRAAVAGSAAEKVGYCTLAISLLCWPRCSACLPSQQRPRWGCRGRPWNRNYTPPPSV